MLVLSSLWHDPLPCLVQHATQVLREGYDACYTEPAPTRLPVIDPLAARIILEATKPKPKPNLAGTQLELSLNPLVMCDHSMYSS